MKINFEIFLLFFINFKYALEFLKLFIFDPLLMYGTNINYIFL